MDTANETKTAATLTADQIAELSQDERDEVAGDEVKTEKLRAATPKSRAAWTPVSQRWIDDRRLKAESTSATRAPGRRAAGFRLVALAEERRALVLEAQRPLSGAGFARNKYAGRCSCGAQVGEAAGWFRRGAGGRVVVYCHSCAWAAACPA